MLLVDLLLMLTLSWKPIGDSIFLANAGSTGVNLFFGTKGVADDTCAGGGEVYLQGLGLGWNNVLPWIRFSLQLGGCV